MPRNRQQIPKAEREGAIVEKAIEQFRANGYRATSVAAVGRAAGIASAAVHWYFPTKDDLFAAALDSIFNAARTRAETDPANAGDPRNELVALLVELAPLRGLHREAYERMDESNSVYEVYKRIEQWLDARLLAAVADRLPGDARVEPVAELAGILFEGLLITGRLHVPLGEFIDKFIGVLAAAATSPMSKSAPRSKSKSRQSRHVR